MEKTRKTFPRLFGKKKESVKVEEGEMKMETEIKKAQEEAKGRVATTSKIAGPEKIIFNFNLWKSKLTAGEEPPKDLLHELQSQLEVTIGKG